MLPPNPADYMSGAVACPESRRLSHDSRFLDARQRVYAYELLFRPSLTSVTSDGGSEAASASVISNAFLNIGLDAMTHGRHAFH
jgi:c-di-GMP-related signal transduction protein